MKVKVPGHTYTVEGYDGGRMQTVRFMMRQGEKYYPGNTRTQGGTNCQELIRVLIDRVKYLDNQVPCEENVSIIGHLREAITLFEMRAIRRHGNIDELKTCKVCGHIACAHGDPNINDGPP